MQNKTLWVVQWNLGGLTGPYKVKLRDYESYYVSECGNFLFDPVDCIRDVLWQVSFLKKRDAEMFAEGCHFTRRWLKFRLEDADDE